MSRKKIFASCMAILVVGAGMAVPAHAIQAKNSPQTPSASRPLSPVQSSVPATQTGCLTNGSGGLADGEQNFSSGSLQSNFRVANANLLATGQPVGLLLHFHGDGAYDYKNPEWSFDAMAASAAKHNMVAISILTPDSSTTTWWKDASANAKWLQALLQQKIFASTQIDLNRVWLVGYSGGTNFISYDVVPHYSNMFCGGGAILFGGGGTPQQSDQFSPSFVANFTIHLYTGQQDTGTNADDGYDAISDSLKSAETYRSRGFQVTEEHPANINHGNIPFAKVTAEQLDLHAGYASAAGAPVNSAVGQPGLVQESTAQQPVAQASVLQGSGTGVISSSTAIRAPWAN